MNKLVVRNVVDFELRKDGENLRSISGYALRWDDEYDFFGDRSIVQTFQRGAFKDALKNHRTAMKIEHRGPAIASTNNDTLKLSEDKEGLRFQATLDVRDTDAQNAYVRTENGTSQGVSVGFIPQKVSTEKTGKGQVRETVEKVKRLYQISLVHDPAYESSEVSAREQFIAQQVRQLESAEETEMERFINDVLTRMRIDRCRNNT